MKYPIEIPKKMGKKKKPPIYPTFNRQELDEIFNEMSVNLSYNNFRPYSPTPKENPQ